MVDGLVDGLVNQCNGKIRNTWADQDGCHRQTCLLSAI